MWRCGFLAGVVAAAVTTLFAATARAAVTVVSQNTYVGQGVYSEPTAFGASMGGTPSYSAPSFLYGTTITSGQYHAAPGLNTYLGVVFPGSDQFGISGSGTTATDPDPFFVGNLETQYH